MQEAERREERMETKKEKTKKQIPLRLSASLYNELAAWAEEEFRSVLYDVESQECREWFQLGGALTGRLLWELFAGPPPRLYF